ncbi:MAG: hypothetical protein JRI59_08710 [Deltaproteobacteria bacterium]|nr:hypothetical protein [Deltaproteobacteria bacterium]
MEKEILRADPEYRRKMLVVMAVVYLTAVTMTGALIFWGHPWMKGYLATLEPKAGLRLITWLLIGIFLSFLPLCGYIFRQGRRIIVSECFPAPGTRVIRDTEVIRGKGAVTRGRLLVGAAILMAFLALAAAVGLPYWLHCLTDSPKKNPKPPSRRGLLV